MRRAPLDLPASLSWLLAPGAPARRSRLLPVEPPAGPGTAIVDLATAEGAALVKGQWRYSDTKIVEMDFKGPGADLQPTGAPIRTYDVTPRAGGADFDDSGWAAIDATTLSARRSTGRLCFNWYRIHLTIPERVGDFETEGLDGRVRDVARRLRRGLGRRRAAAPRGPERRVGGEGLERRQPPGDRARREARAEDPARRLRRQRSALEPAARTSSGCGWPGSSSTRTACAGPTPWSRRR